MEPPIRMTEEMSHDSGRARELHLLRCIHWRERRALVSARKGQGKLTGEDEETESLQEGPVVLHRTRPEDLCGPLRQCRAERLYRPPWLLALSPLGGQNLASHTLHLHVSVATTVNGVKTLVSWARIV